MRDSRHALRKALADHLFRHLAADEDGAARALFAILPGTRMVAVEDHMDALEHEALGIVLERQDALAAQNFLALLGDQVLDPGEEFVGIERLLGLEREGLHVLVVIVLVPAMGVIVVMVVAMLVIMVVVMVMAMLVLALQEGHHYSHDPEEVEGVAAEHLRQRDGAAFGAVDLGIRI